MDDSRIPRQATQWELRGYKRKPGRPRKNWMDIIRRDLKDMDLTWDIKPKNWRQTEQNGVNVWPNAPIWMRDELRSKVKKTVICSGVYFLDQVLITYHYSVILLTFLFFLSLGQPLQKSQRLCRFKSDRDEIWQDCSVTE